jgi:hypothetical protein
LNQHGPVAADMILNESIQRYNGGRYYQWDGQKWVAQPADGPNGYVAKIREYMTTKPWPTSRQRLAKGATVTARDQIVASKDRVGHRRNTRRSRDARKATKRR